jgi:hypothetical protein
MLAIGVGCFWFSPKVTTSNREKYKSPSLKEHLADIKSAMARIDNISELEVPQWKDEVQFATSAITIEEPDEEEDNNEEGEGEEDNPPLISNGSIEFTLQIPFRVQETYGLGQTIEVEEFRVSVNIPTIILLLSFTMSCQTDPIRMNFLRPRRLSLCEDFLKKSSRIIPRFSLTL